MRKAVSVLFVAAPAGTGCGGTADNAGTTFNIQTLTDAGAVPSGSLKPDDLVSFGVAPK
jgi:hypothetical protein